MTTELIASITERYAEGGASVMHEMGLTITEADPGLVRFTLPVAPRLTHAGGVLCGQAIMASMDTVPCPRNDARSRETMRLSMDHTSSWNDSSMRPVLNGMAAASAAVFGIPGFFAPRLPVTALTALSVYDTAPLRDTLLELVDFDLLNHGPVRLSVGAVQVAVEEVHGQILHLVLVVLVVVVMVVLVFHL